MPHNLSQQLEGRIRLHWAVTLTASQSLLAQYRLMHSHFSTPQRGRLCFCVALHVSAVLQETRRNPCRCLVSQRGRSPLMKEVLIFGEATSFRTGLEGISPKSQDKELNSGSAERLLIAPWSMCCVTLYPPSLPLPLLPPSLTI